MPSLYSYTFTRLLPLLACKSRSELTRPVFRQPSTCLNVHHKTHELEPGTGCCRSGLFGIPMKEVHLHIWTPIKKTLHRGTRSVTRFRIPKWPALSKGFAARRTANYPTINAWSGPTAEPQSRHLGSALRHGVSAALPRYWQLSAEPGPGPAPA